MEAKDFSQQKISSVHRTLTQQARQSHVARLNCCRPVLLVAVATALGAPAFAAQTEITISTTAAPATPRINGPTVLGATPGSPFLYAIPATGQSPLTFAATGLPSGLTIDATSGIISGTTPAAGPYPINVTVTNSSGSASVTLTLTAGSTLALTPPMGWNSYDSFDASVKQSDVETQSKAIKSLLQPYGWNTVVIDYRWYDPEDNLDANGRYLPSPSKYPSATGSDGFKTVAAEVHAQGLLFGIHLMRGIPRTAVSKNTPILNSTYKAADAANTGDTCSWDSHMYGVKGDQPAGAAWYDSIYQQYADWGVDFAKVDDMEGGGGLHTSEVVAVHNSIGKTGRSIILSLSPGPNPTSAVATLNANANLWRQVNDFWDTNSLSSMSDEFSEALGWSKTSGITPGHWPDADMLPLGTIGSRQCAFNHNQQVQVMTLWAIMPSPLIFGGLPSKLSGDTWTLPLLTNEEVLAVNQDALGLRAKQITASGSTEVWAKDLSGGRKAVALFNRGTQDATVSVTFAQLGMSGTLAVRDLWHRADVTGTTTGISVNVPYDGALMYTVSPPGGAGGSGGSGGGGSGAGGAGSGGSGGGGATGTSGDAGRGGAPGSGGASGTGGSTSVAGGAAAGGAGGVAGATGLGGTGGGSGRGGAPSSGGSTSVAGGSSGTTSSVGGTGGSAGTGGNGRGGSPGGGGASGSGGSGGLPGTGGGAGGQNSATGGTSGAVATPSSGCSCSLQSPGTSPMPLLLVGALALLAARRRKGT